MEQSPGENIGYKFQQLDLQSNLMLKLQQNGQLTDVVIVAKDKEISAHSMILRATCKYFDVLSQSGLLGPKIDLSNSDSEIVQIVLDFLYTGEFNARDDDVVVLREVLRLCHFLQIVPLSDLCWRKLERNLDSRNAKTILELADICDNRDMCELITDFMENFTKTYVSLPRVEEVEIVENGEFVALSDSFRDISEDFRYLFKKMYQLYNELYYMCDELPSLYSELMNTRKFDSRGNYEITTSHSDVQPEGWIVSTVQVGMKIPRRLLKSCSYGHLLEIGYGEGCSNGHLLEIGYGEGCSKEENSCEKHEDSYENEDSYDKRGSSYGEDFCVQYSLDKEEDSLLTWSWGDEFLDSIEAIRLICIGTSVYDTSEAENINVFNCQSKIWEKPRDTPFYLEHGMRPAVHEKVIYFVGGGEEEKEAKSQVLEYNLSNNKYTKLAGMKHARYCPGVLVFGEILYVIGGANASGHIAEVECCDIKTKEWFSIRHTVEPRFLPNVLAVLDSLYIVGSCSNSSVEVYDFETNEWEIVTQIPAELGETDMPNAAYCQSKIVVAVPNSQYQVIALHLFDVEKKMWTLVRQGDFLRVDTFFTVPDYDCPFVIAVNSTAVGSVYVYAPHLNQWTEIVHHKCTYVQFCWWLSLVTI